MGMIQINFRMVKVEKTGKGGKKEGGKEGKGIRDGHWVCR